MDNRHCVFEYMYRDAGNWKTYGALLLVGGPHGFRETLRGCLEWADLFVAEQVGVPSLYETHLIECDDGPSDLDHAYHEFVDLREATEADLVVLKVVGSFEGGWFFRRSNRWNAKGGRSLGCQAFAELLFLITNPPRSAPQSD